MNRGYWSVAPDEWQGTVAPLTSLRKLGVIRDGRTHTDTDTQTARERERERKGDAHTERYSHIPTYIERRYWSVGSRRMEEDHRAARLLKEKRRSLTHGRGHTDTHALT